MNRTLSKELKKYYKKVDALLICNKAEKKKILSDLKSDIDAKIDDGSITSIGDVIDIFGTPESIVPEYKDSDVIKLRNTRRIVVKSIVIVGIVVILLVAAFITYEMVRAYYDGHGHVEVITRTD